MLRWGGALALLALTPGTRVQAQGVLLGIRFDAPRTHAVTNTTGRPDSLAQPAYRTLLVSHRDSTFVVHATLENLLIPRDDGFWRVGTKRSVYNDWIEDFLWAAPEDVPPDWIGIQAFNGEYCDGHRTQRLSFASSRYLSIIQQSTGYCEGAAHPWFFNTLAVVPIDSVTHPGLMIEDVLGDDARDVLEATAASFLDSQASDGNRPIYIDSPDGANWGLMRRNGQWIAVGRLDAAEEAVSGHYADLPLPLDLPPMLTGHRQPTAFWNRVQALAPDAVDAVLAPGQDWVLVIHPTHLSLHTVRETVIGPSLLTYPLPTGTRVVMTRWADGPQLQRWISRVEQLTDASSLTP